MKSLGVVLLSGGLDSTTVAAYAKKQVQDLIAVTFHYGQKHEKEVQCAKQVAETMGIQQQVVDISFFKELSWYSALTSPDDFMIPGHRKSKTMAEDIPVTYVPFRNTLFIVIAAALLESKALHLIEIENMNPKDLEVSLFIGANVMDYSGYPDCRPEYYEKMTEALFIGSKLAIQYHKQINIQTPIILKTKTEIIELAMDLKAPLEYTWSCYEGGDMPCGGCDSCILRAKGFAEAGCTDPLIARLERPGSIAESKQTT